VVYDPDSGVLSVGAGVAGETVDFTGTDGVRTLTGLKEGDLSDQSTDAVTGAQLHATNQNVAALDGRVTALEENGGGAGDVIVPPDPDGVIKFGANMGGDTIDFSGTGGLADGGARVLTGVADGRIGAGSRDAVNGDQLAKIRDDLQGQIGDLDDRLTGVENGGGGGNPPNPPPNPGDSVTKEEMEKQIQMAKDYADSHFTSLTGSIEGLRQDMDDRFDLTDRRIDRIGAMGTAMSMMTSSMSAVRGQNRVAAGIGAQGSEQALSVGYQRVIESTNAAITLGGSYSGGESQVGVGIGFGW
jgi:autotransporter adhesin